MKANDLMLGDWYAFRGHPYKCTASDIASILECEENGAPTDISEIPLTTEILEKNGFIVKRTESAKRTYWKDRAGQIVGHKNRGLMYMEISGNPVKFGYFLPHFSGHIQFVHELQHALRLCGISKEIVL